jgi:hypothetical protein
METCYERASLPAGELLDRCLELKQHEPNLSPEERERLPRHSLWWAHRDRLAAMEPVLLDL